MTGISTTFVTGISMILAGGAGLFDTFCCSLKTSVNAGD
jgi:hypothetical protein